MEAAKFDSPLRYTVTSEKESEEDYIVDLDKWECACQDYYFRVRMLKKKTGKKRGHSCKHIEIAFKQFAWETLDTYSELIENMAQKIQSNAIVHGSQRIDDEHQIIPE